MRTLLVSIFVLLIPLSYGDQEEGKIEDLVKDRWQAEEGTRVIIEDFSAPLCDSSCISSRMEWLKVGSPNPFILPKQQESSDIKEKQVEDESTHSNEIKNKDEESDAKVRRIKRRNCMSGVRKIL